MLVKIDQWAPDADNTEPGVLVDVDGMIPTMRGYRGAPSGASAGIAALSAECHGTNFVTILSGTDVLIAGTQTKLYMASATTWTDVTRTGSDYTGSSTSRWCFAQQGNVTIATNKIDTPQKYLHGTDTDFSDLTAMPESVVCEAVGEFLMIGNYNDGTDTVDGWACSAIGDYTNWTPSLTTQCVFGRLLDTPGPVTGLKRIADYAVYYKKRSMYLCRYVAGDVIWEFSLLSDIIGSVGQESIIKVGTMHYFLSDDDFYGFDTASIKSIGAAIKEWFNRQCNNLYRHKTIGVHDRSNAICYWFFPSGTSTVPNEYVAYHYKTNRWGRGGTLTTSSIEAAAEYVLGGRRYSDLLSAFPLYSDYDGITYGSFVLSSQTIVPAIVGADHIILTLTGVSETCNMTTSDFGVDDAITMIRRARVRYVGNHTTTYAPALLTNYYRTFSGGNLETDFTTEEVNGRFDFIRSARWHRGKLTFRGDVELTAIDVDVKSAGRE
jgi:hypothetical protein